MFIKRLALPVAATSEQLHEGCSQPLDDAGQKGFCGYQGNERDHLAIDQYEQGYVRQLPVLVIERDRAVSVGVGVTPATEIHQDG
jgi:hypothetical protein